MNKQLPLALFGFFLVAVCVLFVFAGRVDADAVQPRKHHFDIEAGPDMSYRIEIQYEDTTEHKTSIHFREVMMPTVYYNANLGEVVNMRFDEDDDGKTYASVIFEVQNNEKHAYVAMEIPLEVFYVLDNQGDKKKVMVYYKDHLPWAIQFVPRD